MGYIVQQIASPRKSGPAITVEVIVDKTYKFRVDIVPAFEFMGKKWPQFIRPCPTNIPVSFRSQTFLMRTVFDLFF